MSSDDQICDTKDEAIHQIAHDLRASAVNVSGFVGELSDAFLALQSMLNEDGAVSVELLASIDKLFEDDIAPSLKFLKMSAERSHEVCDTTIDRLQADFSYGKRAECSRTNGL